jgi:SnoaL-like protein
MDRQANENRAVQAMLDRHEIDEVLLRYCRACDQVDEGLLRSVFHPDASVEYEGLVGGNVHDTIPTMLKMRRRFLLTMHVLSNVSIEVDGNTARSESYVMAHHRFQRDGAQYEWVAGGRYLDRHERRDGLWAIAHRQTLIFWMRVNRIDETGPPAFVLEP